MRIFMIVGTLVIGLMGLFMSVCGGGFFVVFLFNMVRSLFQLRSAAGILGMLPMMVLAAGFCIGGGLLVRGCAKAIKKWWQ